MDWIEGYDIVDDGLYAPSGEKIAVIARYSGGFYVSPLSPELLEEFGGQGMDEQAHKSVEAACQQLVMAHANHLRVVSVDDVREGVSKVAQVLVEVQGNENQVQISDVQTAIDEASPSSLAKFLKEGLPSAIAGAGLAAAIRLLVG